jgi:Mg-chelatase subunit ChlD
MAALTFEQPWFLALLPPLWLLLVLLAWRRRFRPFLPFLVRLLLAVLIVAALARPQPAREAPTEAEPDARRLLLVDQSDSLGETGRQALRLEAERLVAGDPAARVLYFAGQPVLVAESFGPDAAPLNRTATDLAAALHTAGQLAAADPAPNRLLLLSDGVPTTGDIAAAETCLAGADTPVDVLLPDETLLQSWAGGPNEVRLVELVAPPLLRQGELFSVDAVIDTDQPVSVTLRLRRNDEVIKEDTVPLEQGVNRLGATLTAADIGPQRFEAEIIAAAGDDRTGQNNVASAFAQVYPPSRILVVANEPETGQRMAAELRWAGLEPTLIAPAETPTRLSELEPYAGLVLVDVPAPAFETEQMLAIAEFGRSMGRGLTVVGGRHSFSLGRYEDTPLAGLLPLSLEPPPREERPPVALLLIIDHSGSMLETHGGSPARLVMAKEAAIRATEVLGPEDRLGVLIFDDKTEWVVPFQPVSDGAALLEIQQRIGQIPGGGGTRILQVLQEGIPAMLAQDAATSRLIVLLTDGKSYDGPGARADYDRIVDEATANNITLSTIAIGLGADTELLDYLAGRGRGRYHLAETPEELPELTISESDILRSEIVQRGDFGVSLFAPQPMVRGLFAETPPPNVSGYLAMTPRPQAEVALQVGPGDPLLAVWGYGLGRVAAWSSDLGLEWAAAWEDWPEQARFWGQVVGYTLPAPNLPAGLQVAVEVGPAGIVTIAADSVTPTGRPIDRADPEAVLTRPGGATERFLLAQVGPGRYRREVRLETPGAYLVSVIQTVPDEAAPRIAETGFVIPYPAEYALPPAGSGGPLLQRLAESTGGQTFGLGQLAGGVEALPGRENRAEERPEWWPWLLQIALILWPIEIALRRWGRLRIQ